MMKKVQIAKVAHEINAALCSAFGDNSQPSWEDAPEWQKQSAIDGVTFHLANQDAGPDSSHNEWMRHKLADGWEYGEVKSPDKKTHPCIVAFEDLPPEQQAKDYLFKQVVRSLAFAK